MNSRRFPRSQMSVTGKLFWPGTFEIDLLPEGAPTLRRPPFTGTTRQVDGSSSGPDFVLPQIAPELEDPGAICKVPS